MSIETDLAKLFAKHRKEIMGTGAIDAQVRICADSLFVRFKVTYTPLERAYLKHFEGNQGGYSVPDLEDKITKAIVVSMSSVFPTVELKVKYLFTKFDLDESSSVSYWIARFDENIEKIARERQKKQSIARPEYFVWIPVLLQALELLDIFNIIPFF